MYKIDLFEVVKNCCDLAQLLSFTIITFRFKQIFIEIFKMMVFTTELEAFISEQMLPNEW